MRICSDGKIICEIVLFFYFNVKNEVSRNACVFIELEASCDFNLRGFYGFMDSCLNNNWKIILFVVGSVVKLS